MNNTIPERVHGCALNVPHCCFRLVIFLRTELVFLNITLKVHQSSTMIELSLHNKLEPNLIIKIGIK